MSEEEKKTPSWLLKGNQIQEVDFCDQFLAQYPMICINGTFFDKQGMVEEQVVRKAIFDWIAKHMGINLIRKADNCLRALKVRAQGNGWVTDKKEIHLANGLFVLSEGFQEKKDFCRHRLPVNYDPDCPPPTNWLKFLDDLLEPEDILTLQEFMGYCLIPTNAAQKMLLIIGRGGEGKSRIGMVMRDLLGENMCVGSIAKVENSPFARADLEHKLLMVDDDLKMEALKSTNYIKSIITSEMPMDLEKKGIQSYQGQMYCRLMAFGNSSIQALHDRSYGFFRRQIILTTKRRDRNRENDPFLSERLREEKDSIFLWALEGIYRLWGNNFQFTLSAQAKENLMDSMTEGINAIEFMRSKGYIVFDTRMQLTSRQLYRIYCDWCDDNSLIPLTGRCFSVWLRENLEEYHLEYSGSIPAGAGRYVRGFRGIGPARA